MILPKAIVVDTNVLIHDPQSIETLMNDVNVLFLHSIVIQELDKNKTKRDIGRDCREAIRRIEQLQIEKHPRLKIVQTSDWSSPDLSHLTMSEPDHHIIALAHNLMNDNSLDFKEVKLISKDTTVRILCRDLFIPIKDYVSSDVVVSNTKMKEIEVPSSILQNTGDEHIFTIDKIDQFQENEGVICWSDWNGRLDPSGSLSRWGKQFTAIKKGDSFHVIPNDISVMGLTSYCMNGCETNWEQYVAIRQLLDPSVKLCFLIGGAGSGKTLLSLAAAIEQRKMFRNILITRPMVHLEDEDNMGFLPGDINDKMNPWLRPIWKSLSFIGNINKDNNSVIQKVRDDRKLEIEPLDYIRGMTFVKDILIVDEAQNLTPHQTKTIITRAGEGCKIIFTGDLGQIDRTRKVDATSNGLAYASVKMSDQPMTSVCHFQNTVRSPLANLAEKLL